MASAVRSAGCCGPRRASPARISPWRWSRWECDRWRGACSRLRLGETRMKFTYGSGQRPLDGFVLKRGIGRGGFGEVYFAVSDGGKEVALKLLRGSGNTDIELRGVVQCLNLKHPNLVALYDLKTDA